MKTSRILGIVLIVAAVLIVGFRFLRHQLVQVTFTNEATHALRSVQLQSKQGASPSITLGRGESRTVSLRIEGEFAVTPVVTFEDGRILQTTGLYVEPGYRLRATIGDNDVHVEYE